MEDQLFNSILAGLSGGVPLAVPMFIYLHMTIKHMNERIGKKEQHLETLAKDVTDLKVHYASEHKTIERLKTHGMVP